MDSWVEEKMFLFDPSSSRLDHDSLVDGHSLKKGCTGCCCSCFTDPGELISLPKKQCCCLCFEMQQLIRSIALGTFCWANEWPTTWDSDFWFIKELEGTWEGMRRHAPIPVLVPKPRLSTLAGAPGEKLWSSCLEVSPWMHLYVFYLQYTLALLTEVAWILLLCFIKKIDMGRS